LEEYFEVNDIAEDKKVPALLTLLGGKTYSLLRNLTAPKKPKEKDYTTLVNLLRDHLMPKPIVIAERFRFHKRNQLQCDSVNAYIAELRKLTEFCEFGLHLNDTLRDRFVCGLRNDQIQKKLLKKSGTQFLVPGNCKNAGFCTIYPRASGGLTRPQTLCRKTTSARWGRVVTLHQTFK
jgi:hypothetical protein